MRLILPTMLKFGLLITLALLFGFANPVSAKPPQSKRPTIQPLTPRQLFEQCKPAVVTIKTDKGNGTGFLAGQGAYVITCYHVIEGATELSIKDYKGRPLTIHKVGLDKATDSALIMVEPRGDRGSLPLVRSNEVSAGDPIVVIGNPLGFLSQTLTTGVVSGKRQDGNAKLIQIDAAISPGSSGGPIIDSYGNAIGFVSFTFTKGQSLNMGVACFEAAKVLDRGFRTYAQFIADNRAMRTPPVSQGAINAVATDGTESDPIRKEQIAVVKHYSKILGDIFKPLMALELDQRKWAAEELPDDRLRVRSENAYNDVARVLTKDKLLDIPSKYVNQSTIDALFEYDKLMRDYTTEMQLMLTAYQSGQDNLYKEHLKEVSTKLRLLETSFFSIFKGLIREPWFDFAVYHDSISAPVYVVQLQSLLNTISPEPSIEGSAVVARVTAGSVLQTGDVIMNIQKDGTVEWHRVDNWKDVIDYLLVQKIKIANVKVSRDGKIIEMTAVFHE